MKPITLPPESADLINAERSLQEAARFVDEAEAKLRRVSSPNFVDEDDVQRNAAIKRGEFPNGPRKATSTKIAEAQPVSAMTPKRCTACGKEFATF